MTFVINYESECSTKRTADMSYSAASSLLMEEVNNSQYIIDFWSDNYIHKETEKRYLLKGFKRRVGIFTETVMLLPYNKMKPC